MRDQGAIDESVRQIATRQGGVVSARQLAALGWDKRAVSRRVKAGRLRAVHRSVYAVGHDHLGAWGRSWAAVLACGERAVLSHRAAAVVWRLLPAWNGPIDVSVRGDGQVRERDGIRIHRRAAFTVRDVTTHHGLPITTRERTLLDLAATANAKTVKESLTKADAQRALNHTALTALAASRQPGAKVLRQAMGLPTTESPLEDLFLAFCTKHGLPSPQTQVPLGRYRADFLWPEAKFIVEADSHGYHRRRFEEDRERDVALAALGYLTLRVTKRALTEQTAQRLRKVLSERLP